MGNCCERPEDKLDKQLVEDFKEQQKMLKLLLLGTAGGGKSTLLKQMQILHTNGFNSPEERARYRANVHANVVIALERLMQGADILVARWELPETEAVVKVLANFLKIQQCVDPMESPDFLAALKLFWKEPAVHDQLVPNGAQFQMLECTAHFMNSIDRIAAKDYVPSMQDILLMRVPTTGIVEVNFIVNKFPFRVFDVGGQNVHAIIFVAALSEFDETLEEDNKTNRIMESLRLFRSICCAKWFISTSIILFLNKKDLFEQKVRNYKSIKPIFQSYTGSDSYEDQIAYLEYKFNSMNPNPHKHIYTHRTCATDTNQMELVLKNVFEMVLMSIYKKMSMY